MFTDRLVSRLLIVTAVVNIVAGVAALASPSLHAELMFAGDVRLDGLILRYHVMLWLFVVALGIGYAVAARRPSEQRGLLVAGGLGKLVAAGVWAEMLASGVGAPMMAAGIAFDGALGIVFLLHAWRGPRGLRR
jgi:hypothetical protein